MGRRAFIALLASTAIAGALDASVLVAQPADFSGKWTLEAPAVVATPAVPGTPAAAAAPGDMGSGWGTPITIAQDATRLRVEYVAFSRYDMQPPLVFTYPLDGSEGSNTVTMGRGEQVETSTARWDGQALIVTTTSHVDDRRAGPPFIATVTRTLRLESPTTLTVEVTRAGVLGGPAVATRSVYRKG